MLSAGAGARALVGLARVAAVAAVAATLWTAIGLAGVVVAAVVGVVWALATPTYAVAVAGVLFATLVVDGGGAVEAAAAASLAFVFVADILVLWPAREALVGIAVLVTATVGLAGAWVLEPLVAAATGTVAAFALLAYAIHRYEFVRLGLLEEAEP